jgi:hypothetical protein
MNPAVWLIGVIVGAVLGGAGALLRRPWGIPANLAFGVLGGGIGAWLWAIFGAAPDSKVGLAGAAAVGALALIALLWSLKR